MRRCQKLLKKLSEVNGVPGNEYLVANLIKDEIKDLVTEVKTR